MLRPRHVYKCQGWPTIIIIIIINVAKRSSPLAATFVAFEASRFANSSRAPAVAFVACAALRIAPWPWRQYSSFAVALQFGPGFSVRCLRGCANSALSGACNVLAGRIQLLPLGLHNQNTSVWVYTENGPIIQNMNNVKEICIHNWLQTVMTNELFVLYINVKMTLSDKTCL